MNNATTGTLFFYLTLVEDALRPPDNNGGAPEKSLPIRWVTFNREVWGKHVCHDLQSAGDTDFHGLLINGNVFQIPLGVCVSSGGPRASLCGRGRQTTRKRRKTVLKNISIRQVPDIVYTFGDHPLITRRQRISQNAMNLNRLAHRKNSTIGPRTQFLELVINNPTIGTHGVVTRESFPVHREKQ